MQGISKVPGTNAMAVFHDQWALDWKMPPGVLQATIYPAIVLTYNGTTAPLLEQVRMVALKDVQNNAGKNDEHNAPLIYKDATKDVPIKNDQVETSYICAKGADSRSILVEIDDKDSKFACRVIYRSNLTRKVPWRAVNDEKYCHPKAQQLARMQLDMGYSCMVAYATPRAVAVQ